MHDLFGRGVGLFPRTFNINMQEARDWTIYLYITRSAANSDETLCKIPNRLNDTSSEFYKQQFTNLQGLCIYYGT